MREYRVRVEDSGNVDKLIIAENVEIGTIEIDAKSGKSNHEAVTEYLKDMRKLRIGEPFRILWYSATGGAE